MNQQRNENENQVIGSNGQNHEENLQLHEACRRFFTGRIRFNDRTLRYYIHEPFIWHQMPNGLQPRFFTCFPLPQNAPRMVEQLMKFEANPNSPEFFDESRKRKCPIGNFPECEDLETEDQVRDHILLAHFHRGFKCRGFDGRVCRFLTFEFEEMERHLMVSHRMHLGTFDYLNEIEAINDVFNLKVPELFQ